MATLSAIAKLPRPELTDPPNAISAFVNLTNTLDKIVIPLYASAPARDVDIPSPTPGQHAFLNDSDSLTVYSDSAGRWLTYTAGQVGSKAMSFWETKEQGPISLTLATAATDVPGCSSTFTTVRPGAVIKVDIAGDFSTAGTSAGTGILLAQLDGVDQPRQVNFSGSNTNTGLRATCATSFFTTAVAAGSHTVKLRSIGTTSLRLNGPHTNLTVSVYE